ncbi:polysaccharide lyase 6 family protein [Vibrio gallicus]|uniref:polysaccharide lyase 6 family protein n=1 Tax=Vibrio gallicus TaxID=190897 RepID=UPI0021C31A4A|nr:polysaccharide lyase 6 family protein [Vibrio gallicus]
MSKHILAILIGLALVGCNDGKDSNNSPSDIPDNPDSSIPADPDSPESETPLPPISEDLTFYSSGIPEAVIEVPEVVCSEVFDSTSDLQKAVSTEMAPGTTLCLADGEYDDGLYVKFGGQGTAQAPIKVAAEHPGKAIITGGDSKVAMAGSHVQVQGFVFNDVTYSSSLIETRHGTHNLCTDCRITEISVVDAKPSGISGILVHIYGQGIWLDHSILSGKNVKNPMVSFNRWVDSSWDEETKLNELARDVVVYKNYIANRPPTDGKLYADSSDNDYEAIRTGLSDTHHYPGDSFIVGNLFENIQGEAEVISNKGTNNVISHNTIRHSYGSLTTRHGGQAKINNNFIFGDGHPFAGGIRIVDGDHEVTNNYIEGARYLSTTHHGGIVLLGSDGSGDSDNGYQQVENVHLAHNTIVDSVNSLNLDGGGKKTQPDSVYMANNLVDKAIGPIFTSSDRGVPTNSNIAGNIVSGQSVSDSSGITASESGFEFSAAELKRHSEDGLYRISSNTPNIDAVEYARGDFSKVTIDMDGQQRSDTTLVGADDNNLTDDRQYRPLDFADVGPTHYRIAKPEPTVVVAQIENFDFANGLDAWSGFGSEKVTGDDAFAHTGSALISENGYLSQSVGLLPNHNYELSAFVKGGYRLSIDGLAQLQDVVSSEEYQWVRIPFNSGVSTTANITLGIPTEVTMLLALQDPNFVDFRNNGGSSDVWVTQENSNAGYGDVGSSGDTAFGDGGSARIRFRKDVTEHHFDSQPGVSQVVSGLPHNTDVSYSLYYCDNKKDESLSTLYFGIKDSHGEVIKGQYAHVKDLGDAPQGSSKTCFKKVSTTFNTGSNDSVEVFANMAIDIDNTMTDEEIYANSQFTSNELEVRLDAFSLSYQGEPSDDLMGYFDEIRLVTRNDQ